MLLVVSGISFTILLIFGIYFLINYNVNSMNQMMGGAPTTNILILSLVLFAVAISIVIAVLLYFVHGKDQKRTSITITAKSNQLKSAVLPNRMSTGFADLDALLYGGLPKHYAVALTSPPSDERELLMKRFVESGALSKEIVFDITTEAGESKVLAEKYSNFYLFICNPQADAMISNLPNIFKVKGIDNLTDIDIALTKAFRILNSQESDSKRICIQIVSDILLQHHAVTTRRWLSALLPSLKSKGFTILAVIDPQMHQSEELEAVLSVFDGEIRINEKETAEGNKQILNIRRLSNQEYQENEITITKEKLEH